MRHLYILITIMMALFASPVYAGGMADGVPSTVSPDSQDFVAERIIVQRILPDGSLKNDTIYGAKILIEEQSVTLTPQGGSTPAVQPSSSVKERKMRNVMLGMEVSTSLDLSGSDLSTFNLDALIGYRHKVIQFLGLSVGLHKSLGSRDSFIPIQAVFRTGFRSRPTLAFVHAAVGYSFNTISSSPMFGDTCAALGVGANLVNNPKFQSNIILSFGFRHFNERHRQMTSIKKPNLGYAQISFGLSF